MAFVPFRHADRGTVPRDLISVKEACGLAPAPKGNRTGRSVLLRWILKGRLRAWRLEGRPRSLLFVSRAEALGLLRARTPAAPALRVAGRPANPARPHHTLTQEHSHERA